MARDNTTPLTGYIPKARCDPMTREAERELAILMRIPHTHETMDDARRRFIEHNMPMVVAVAKNVGCDREFTAELVSVGNLALIACVDGFNPYLGFRFSSYAYISIRTKVRCAVAARWNATRLPVAVGTGMARLSRGRSLSEFEADLARLGHRQVVAQPDDPVTDRVTMAVFPPREVGLAETEEYAGEMAALRGVLAHLAESHPRYHDVIRRRYGIGCEPETLDAIARSQGCTRARVHQIEDTALVMLWRHLTRTGMQA